MKLNKNSNWYTTRFTEISVSVKKGLVHLSNYFTGESIFIHDKSFAKKIDYYLYLNHEKGIFLTHTADFSIWINQRKFNKKYDNLLNR